MTWIPLDITIPADRETVALALYRAGYTVRQRKRKGKSQVQSFRQQTSRRPGRSGQSFSG